MALYYHTLAFFAITARNKDKIERALFQEPMEIRQRHLGTKRDLIQEGDNAKDVWDVLRDYLEDLEKIIQDVASRYNVFEWLHVFRRIGVSLHSGHSGKTDATTIALVRRISELAILKYAKSDPEFVIKTSKNVPLKNILGGHFLKSFQSKSKDRSAGVRTAMTLISEEQWVLDDFSEENIIDCYRLEGLAYEYWQVTANLRTVGKMAATQSSASNTPALNLQELSSLAEIYDHRNAQTSAGATLSANFYDIDSDFEKTSTVLLPFYNAEGVKAERFKPQFFKKFPNEFCSNFLIGPLDLKKVRDAHSHLASPFEKRFGFSLDDALLAINAIGLSMMLPVRAKDIVPSHLMFQLAYETISQRAYKVTQATIDEIKVIGQTLIQLNKMHFPDATCEGVSLALDDLRFDHRRGSYVGLWSGGRWFPIIESANGMILNSYGLGEHIHRMFVGVRDKLGDKGLKFEAIFRKFVEDSGISIEQHGELVFADGTIRELDCGVRIGRTLILFECRAMERPLDYDLGKPSVLEARKLDFEGKCEQIISLFGKIESNKKGRNFDFSWANVIEGYVVSPFVEFAYERSNLYFLNNRPRIISPKEAVDMLKEVKAELGAI